MWTAVAAVGLLLAAPAAVVAAQQAAEPTSVLTVEPDDNLVEGEPQRTTTVAVEVSEPVGYDTVLAVTIERVGGPVVSVTVGDETILDAQTDSGVVRLRLPAYATRASTTLLVEALDDDLYTGDGQLVFSGAWQ